MKEEIKKVLEKIVSELTQDSVPIQIDIPDDATHGDYATNVALVLFGRHKDSGQARMTFNNPRELAEHIVNRLITEKIEFLEKAEVAGPGFINFWISRDTLVSYIAKIHDEKEKFGHGKLFESEKIMLEFGDPNPFKEFHIGHLYTCTVGESLSRLSEYQNADVWRVCYQGDVGLHVAKTIYGLLKHNKKVHDLRDKSLLERVKELGAAYAEGTKDYEDEAKKQDINQLNKKIYERTDPEINELYDAGKQWSLEYFDTIYKRLGTHYEKHYFESEVGKIGLEFIKEHLGTVFEESDGAVIFPGKKHGLHNRVFINSLGLPTYEAKELGLAPTKYKDFPYDKAIIITGNEINEYFRVLIKALSLIKPELAEKTVHLGHGMVRLPEGKMSSRTGNIIPGEWLLDTAKEKIIAAYPDMNSETAEKVSIGAVKYALLRSGIGNDIAFSFEESISFEGNSGPYLQYTYARTQSIIRKAEEQGFSSSHSRLDRESIDPRFRGDDTLEIEESLLLRHLLHFQEVVEEAAEKFAPNLICNYLFELAQKFNHFYQKHSVLDGGDKKEFRLGLTAAVGQTLKNGLQVLGIEAPEKM